MFEAARDIFCHAADEDYAVARLSWKHGFSRHFLWNASQAIEKYLKSASLINGCDAKFEHDWLNRFNYMTELAAKHGSPLSDILVPCHEAVLAFCNADVKDYTEATSDFVSRIHRGGSPSIRYNESPRADVQSFDLHKLDFVVKWLRGLSIPLDEKPFGDASQGADPHPGSYDFQAVACRYPILLEANFAFNPKSEHNPMLRAGWTQAPIESLVARDQEDVINWLRSSSKLSDRTLKTVRLSIEERLAHRLGRLRG